MMSFRTCLLYTSAILNAKTLAEVEDLYRPYKQKRKTRASVAREKGLAPLADMIRAQNTFLEPISMAVDFIDEEKGVTDAEQALAGALDIIAEEISDDAQIRKDLKSLIANNGVISATGDENDEIYAMYRCV